MINLFYPLLRRVRRGYLRTRLLRLARFYLFSLKLHLADKLTLLISTVIFCIVLSIFSILALLFLSVGVGHLLAATVAPRFAYLIVAAFYIIILLLLFLLRRRLFVAPVARFIAKLLIN